MERAGARFPKPTLDEPAGYALARWKDRELETWTVGNEAIVVSHVQPVEDGVLLVGARSRWRAQGADQNAVVYGSDGRERRRFLLGDGIADVRSTRRGTIWVSYFDEGVFGNFGWGHPGPEPVGSAGLIEFGAAGERLLTYDPAVAGTDSICDAYALGLDERDAAWVYFYTEFSIVRVDGGRYSVWKTDTAGAQALAVRDGYAFLFGDYKRRNFGRIAGLAADGCARVIEEVAVVDESGSPECWQVGSARVPPAAAAPANDLPDATGHGAVVYPADADRFFLVVAGVAGTLTVWCPPGWAHSSQGR